MKTTSIPIIMIMGFMLSPFSNPSCDKLISDAVEIVEAGTSSGSGTSIGQSEIIEGLKTALLVGTDSSVSITSRLNGFYQDEAIKILLPPEASILYENKDKPLLRAIGLDQKIEEAVLSLNRAAEDAAKEAGPVFKSAIRSMTISDGLSVLNGKNPAVESTSSSFDSTAATGYLKSLTAEELRNSFSPIVNRSLDKKLSGNFSPNEIWSSLSSAYNTVANRSFGAIEPMETTDLGAYVTQKALDGLFLKVAEEEIEIRRDPLDWAATSVGNLLERVFGPKS